MAVAIDFGSNSDLAWMASTLGGVVHSLRVELVCVLMVGLLWAMGTFTRSRIAGDAKLPALRPKRPIGFAPAARRPSVPLRVDAGASTVGGQTGPNVQGPANAAIIIRDLAVADATQLRDTAWVVPRITQLCRTQVQVAMETYASALRAGLDLQTMPLHDCQQLFVALVTSSIRISQTDDTLKLLRDLRSLGPGVDAGIFSSVVKLCTSKHLFTECLTLYDFAMEDEAFVIDDKSIWSCLLFCGVESKSFQRCNFFFDRLKAIATPSQKDYWNMIRFGSTHGDWQLLVRLLEEMTQAGVEADSIIYNTVLACCVSSNQIDHARVLLEQMTEAGNVTDVITYNTLMKGYAKSGDISNCFQLYTLMLTRGLPPSQVTFGILLDVCINENQVDRASEVFNTMTKEGCPMNTVLYTTLIKGFARVGKVDEAMKVYEQMSADRSVPPDLITFSILIKANCDASRLEVALDLLSASLRYGLKPDEVVFNNLLAGCAKHANAELAKRLYTDMVASGIRPSNATFSILIRLYAQCKMLDEAVEMLRTEPALHQVEVEPRLFSQLLQCCIRARQGRRAVEVYQCMVEHSTPSVVTHGTILGMCAKLNMFDTAADILAIAAENGGRVGAADATALVEGAARKRKTQCVEACVAAMEKLGLPVPHQLLT